MRTVSSTILMCLVCQVTILCQSPVNTYPSVRIWEDTVLIPTYPVDEPDLNPRFYEGRAYQGAQGRVYPYPIYESLSDTRIERQYEMVFLENEYIKINILPEIGGRLFGALDKTDGYDFIYRQHVIKPGLIGMLGAWISGGIEWNFPHHHRATAYMPVDHTLQENPDSSATLWIGELELRHRMKFMLGISVYPGKSYFEVTFRPFNSSPFAHSFLYFANTGVHTSEEYQVIFPPSTQFGTYHGKNQFLRWPVSHEEYNQVDYTDGVDVSWWKNHPEWTSIFCWNYEDDFVGGYDHGREAGTVCFSNHHIAPGKKFWTWSTGPRGKLWDEALTETDGPELEIMIGGYSDNQPDYSWLQPYESKYLKQYWYPVREIGGVKNANLEAAVNLTFPEGKKLRVGFNTTSMRKDARMVLEVKGKKLYEKVMDIDPAHPFITELKMPEHTEETDVKVLLYADDGTELISYQPEILIDTPMPETAKPPAAPEDIETIEELYFAGLRLEQFYNPSLRPEPYYQEALKRDPGDYRVNTAMGLLYLRKGMYDKAGGHLETAVKRITNNYTKPRDGEAYYYLGLCRKFQKDYDDACTNLYQATWSQAFHSAAYYQLAETDCMRGEYEKALQDLDRSLTTNTTNTRAGSLRSAILRRLGRYEEACGSAEKVLVHDPLDFWSVFEFYLNKKALGQEASAEDAFWSLLGKMRGYEQSFLELSLNYANAGLWDEAIDVLSHLYLSGDEGSHSFPLAYYFLGYFWHMKGDETTALQYFRQAAEKPPDYCFPFRLESIDILEQAIRSNPSDAKAPYYLGDLLYENQPEKAIRLWEQSRELDDTYPVVHRNLGLAYYKQDNDMQKAIGSYLKAISLDHNDQRLLYELDLIYAAGREAPETRLKLLQEHHVMIAGNNVADALSREVMLLVQLTRYDEALAIAENNYFRQWEGVSKAYDSYVDAHLLRGWQHYHSGDYELALKDYLNALVFPDNMMVAEPYRGGRLGQIYYFAGMAYQAMNNKSKAAEYYRLAADRRENEGLSENHYYKALALLKLGKTSDAEEIFDGLIRMGKQRLESQEVDFFAKFGERQTPDDRKSEACYLMGLGYLGRKMDEQAKTALEKAVQLNINHIWAAALLSQMTD